MRQILLGVLVALLQLVALGLQRRELGRLRLGTSLQRLAVSGAASKPLLLDVPNSVAVRAGDRVGLAVDPAAIRLLPGEEA